MTPVTCQIPHKPDEGKYGDCLRACVASILDLAADDVPNFSAGIADQDDGMLAFDRLTVFLTRHKMVPLYIAYNADHPGSFEDIMRLVAYFNGNTHAILMCSSARDSNHAVVIKGGAVVHDPSWGGKLDRYEPTSEGFYGFIFFGAAV